MERSDGPILVLDDNEGNRLLLEVALRTAGYEVHSASTGEEALQQLHTCSFAAALVDVNLSEEDGLETARRLRTMSEPLVLIAVTVDDDDETIERARQAGCDAFVAKPFDLDRFINFIRQLDLAAMRRQTAMTVIDSFPGHQFRR